MWSVFDGLQAQVAQAGHSNLFLSSYVTILLIMWRNRIHHKY